MSKEMFISSSPHETKLAVVEDDQLVEVYYERDTDVGLVGGIYKGRVSRVLPGMQSAFVDIGLERDAFLYVSDFYFEDQEDYDKILEEAEACAVHFTNRTGTISGGGYPTYRGGEPEATPQMIAPVPAIPQISSGAAPAQASLESQPVEIITPETPVTSAAGATPAASISPGPTGRAHEQSHFEPRGRRWRHRGRRVGEHRHGEHKFIPTAGDFCFSRVRDPALENPWRSIAMRCQIRLGLHLRRASLPSKRQWRPRPRNNPVS